MQACIKDRTVLDSSLGSGGLSRFSDWTAVASGGVFRRGRFSFFFFSHGYLRALTAASRSCRAITAPLVAGEQCIGALHLHLGPDDTWQDGHASSGDGFDPDIVPRVTAAVSTALLVKATADSRVKTNLLADVFPQHILAVLATEGEAPDGHRPNHRNRQAKARGSV